MQELPSTPKQELLEIDLVTTSRERAALTRREEEADHTGVTKQQQQQERRNESSAPNKYPVTTPQTVVNFVRGAHRRLQLTAGSQVTELQLTNREKMQFPMPL
ncbi:hypothetical protein HPB47_003126 [Ixodes persulcatus]|uniref:Uncharacterized protein n=1 Tax=Ixodes persulcatus TaxID=34615 RepID=A0AC60PKF8_IXOPE|nr:hypothetical protein HPB47_003126 [Ixodes persulcatus]